MNTNKLNRLSMDLGNANAEKIKSLFPDEYGFLNTSQPAFRYFKEDIRNRQ